MRAGNEVAPQQKPDYAGEPISAKTKLNLANLVLIEEKLSLLAECLRKAAVSQIS